MTDAASNDSSHSPKSHVAVPDIQPVQPTGSNPSIRRIGLCGLGGGLMLALLVAIVLNWKAKQPTVAIPTIEPNEVTAVVAEALTDLRRRLEKNPASAALWGQYGMCLMQHDRPREAITCFEMAKQLDPQEPRWHYFTGIILEQTDLSAAVAHFETALRLDSNFEPLRLRLVAALMTLGSFESAQQHLERLSQNPECHGSVYVQLARIARLQNTPDEATRWLELARSRNSVSRDLLLEVARSKQQQGRADEAAALLHENAPMLTAVADSWMEQVQRTDVSGAVASLSADQLRQQGQLDQAAQVLATLARRFPERSRPALNLALTLRDQGRLQEAAAETERLCQAFPDDPLLRFHHAVMQSQLGDRAGAMQSLETCLALKPDYGMARAAWADLLALDGRTDECLTAYRRAKLDSPSDPWIRLGLINQLFRNGKTSEARDELESADAIVDANQPAAVQELNRLRQLLSQNSGTGPVR